jgi:hypothetical protein
MKIRWMAVAISLVCILSFAATSAWAGRNSHDPGKRGFYLDKSHHAKAACDSGRRGNHRDLHNRFGLKSIYKKDYRHHRAVRKHHRGRYPHGWYPGQSPSVFGIFVCEPRWGFGYYTVREP